MAEQTSKHVSAEQFYHDAWTQEHGSDPHGDWPMRFAEAYAALLGGRPKAEAAEAKLAELAKEPDWHSFYTDSQCNLYDATEEVSQLEAKVAELQKSLIENDELRAQQVSQLDQMNWKLVAERDRLQEALRRYGGHEVLAGVSCCASFDGKPCDCGFSAALGDPGQG
jgi:hypothetical protein